jgi:hypothetical protein
MFGVITGSQESFFFRSLRRLGLTGSPEGLAKASAAVCRAYHPRVARLLSPSLTGLQS